MSVINAKLEECSNLNGLERMTMLQKLIKENPDAVVNSEEYRRLVEEIIKDPSISSSIKLSFGEEINRWGDPRLLTADSDEYWVDFSNLDIQVAKFLVTIKEWKAFLEDGYDTADNWSEEGLRWKEEERPSWNDLANEESAEKYLFDNQPVVGVCWFEAEAFATAHNARLMDFYERESIVRGDERRPYPWGSPFGYGNANTEEEGLKKPAAVGLYHRDITPEGIADLAGNVAEWTMDVVENKIVIHPGSWNVNSLGAWAKASSLISPAARIGDLGFRLVRDID